MCLATVVLQEVGFTDQVDEVLSAQCLDVRCFFAHAHAEK